MDYKIEDFHGVIDDSIAFIANELKEDRERKSRREKDAHIENVTINLFVDDKNDRANALEELIEISKVDNLILEDRTINQIRIIFETPIPDRVVQRKWIVGDDGQEELMEIPILDDPEVKNVSAEELSNLALKCIAYLFADYENCRALQAHGAFQIVLDYFTRDYSLFAMANFASISKSHRNELIGFGVIYQLNEALFNHIEIDLENLCKLAKSLFTYDFYHREFPERLEQDYLNACIDFVELIWGYWNEMDSMIRALFVSALTTSVVHGKVNQISRFLDWAHRILATPDLDCPKYISAVCKYIFMLIYMYSNIITDEETIMSFFDFAIAQTVSDAPKINESIEKLMIKLSQIYHDFIMNHNIVGRLAEAASSSTFEAKTFIALALSITVLECNDAEIITISSTPDVFQAICRCEADAYRPEIVTIMKALCRIAEIANINNFTCIRDIVFEDSDFNDWVNDVLDESTDPSFYANGDKDIIDSFNTNVQLWLVAPETE